MRKKISIWLLISLVAAGAVIFSYSEKTVLPISLLVLAATAFYALSKLKKPKAPLQQAKDNDANYQKYLEWRKTSDNHY